MSDSSRYYLWRKSSYYLQKFPNTKGINIVQVNSFYDSDIKALNISIPGPTVGQAIGPSNIVLVPNDTSNAISYEIGHVFRLPHVNVRPLNLMCGATHHANFITQVADEFMCVGWIGAELNADQVKTAIGNAAQLVEQ